MFNLFKSELPLLDPKEFEVQQLGYQQGLWNNHPFHLTINLANQNKKFSLTHAFYQKKEFLLSKDGGNLKPIKGNDNDVSKSFEIYHDVIFKNVIEHFIDHIKEIKDNLLNSNQDLNYDLNQEEKDYQWLLATTNILQNSITKNKISEDFLLQYHLHINFKDDCFLKMQCFNLFFEFYQYNKESHSFKVIVLDNKNNQHEPANQYRLNFLEQIPRVVDILSGLLSFLKDNSPLDIKS